MSSKSLDAFLTSRWMRAISVPTGRCRSDVMIGSADRAGLRGASGSRLTVGALPDLGFWRRGVSAWTGASGSAGEACERFCSEAGFAGMTWTSGNVGTTTVASLVASGLAVG